MIRAARAALLALALLPSMLPAQPKRVANISKKAVFAATGLPPGIAIDPQTGILFGSFDRGAIVDGSMTYDVAISRPDVKRGTRPTYIRMIVPNAPPTAVADNFTVEPGSISTLPVLANDQDDDGDMLVIMSARSDTAQFPGFSPAGIRYHATSEAGTTETISYVVSDGHGGQAVAHVNVTISKAH